MKIQTAVIEDLPELRDIYNYEVEHGASTLDLTVRTMEDRLLWFNAHNRENHPLLDAVDEGDGHIMGYASLSPYRNKEAYRTTVEASIYVAPADRRKGVASKLMEALIETARKDPGTHLIVSVITGGNTASEHLHEKFGFTFVGTMHEVGMKFGRYLDIDNYELKV